MLKEVEGLILLKFIDSQILNSATLNTRV
jgi:hypothetical protein